MDFVYGFVYETCTRVRKTDRNLGIQTDIRELKNPINTGFPVFMGFF